MQFYMTLNKTKVTQEDT